MSVFSRCRTQCLLLLVALVSLPPVSVSAHEDLITRRVAVLKDRTKTSKERRLAASELGALGEGAAAAIPVFIDLLEEDDRELRQDVCEALGKIGVSAVPALSDAFRSGNERRKAAAARALASIGAGAKPAVPCLVAGLGTSTPVAVRLQVVRALGSIPDTRAVKALGDEVLNEPDFAVRHAAVLSLRWLGQQAEGGLEPLLNLLRVLNELIKQKKPLPELSTEQSPETPPSVLGLKLTVLGAMTAIGTKRISWIAKLLQDPDPVMRVDALCVLADMGEKGSPAVPAMMDCLKHADAEMRTEAARALGHLGRHAKTAVPALEKCFHDTSNDFRINAAGACLRIDPKHPTAMATLLQGLKDSDWSLRAYTLHEVRALHVRSDQVLNAVAAACSDKNADVREEGVSCLGDMVASMPLALPVIEAALKDPCTAVRMTAATSLPNSKNLARVVPALVRALEDISPGVRHAAATSLGKLGKGGASAIPALMKCSDDQDESVRKAAASALEDIKNDSRDSEKIRRQ
jgi:HEAT repeat protein